jgi:hypothetical protein
MFPSLPSNSTIADSLVVLLLLVFFLIAKHLKRWHRVILATDHRFLVSKHPVASQVRCRSELSTDGLTIGEFWSSAEFIEFCFDRKNEYRIESELTTSNCYSRSL